MVGKGRGMIKVYRLFSGIYIYMGSVDSGYNRLHSDHSFAKDSFAKEWSILRPIKGCSESSKWDLEDLAFFVVGEYCMG